MQNPCTPVLHPFPMVFSLFLTNVSTVRTCHLLFPRGAKSHLLLIITLGLATVMNTGCVRRRLTIRSNPVGAVVYVDDQRIGQTPVSTDFTYYGTRKIRIVKDGYETLSTLQTIDAPWYEIPPLDFVSENLIGREIRDERVLDFQLQPQRMIATDELLRRANNLRSGTNINAVAPLPGTGVPTAAPLTTPGGSSPIPIGTPPPGGGPIYVPGA
jgi:PEGA domain